MFYCNRRNSIINVSVFNFFFLYQVINRASITSSFWTNTFFPQAAFISGLVFVFSCASSLEVPIATINLVACFFLSVEELSTIFV